MKILGIIVGITGAVLFVWHLVKVMLDTEIGTGIFTPYFVAGRRRDNDCRYRHLYFGTAAKSRLKKICRRFVRERSVCNEN